VYNNCLCDFFTETIRLGFLMFFGGMRTLQDLSVSTIAMPFRQMGPAITAFVQYIFCAAGDVRNKTKVRREYQ
jgi:hypothetical protein